MPAVSKELLYIMTKKTLLHIKFAQKLTNITVKLCYMKNHPFLVLYTRQGD